LIYEVLEDALRELGKSTKQNNKRPTQSPVMAVTAPAVVDQNNPTAVACAANAFDTYQRQQPVNSTQPNVRKNIFVFLIS
jgi:hypothetical protein